MRRWRWAWLCLGGAVWGGCVNVMDYRTAPDEVFRGEVVGSAQPDAGADRAGFLHGFDSDAILELSFDPMAALTATANRVGMLDTYRCGQPVTGSCPAELRQAGPISEMALQAIPGLSQDVLSQYDFPGGNRVRSFIFHGSFETDGYPRSAMVFVSLMASGGVEVRVTAPPLAVDGQRLPPLFGVFPLRRASR